MHNRVWINCALRPSRAKLYKIRSLYCGKDEMRFWSACYTEDDTWRNIRGKTIALNGQKSRNFWLLVLGTYKYRLPLRNRPALWARGLRAVNKLDME